MAALLDFMTPGAIEAGCDEAGRGCLAGPVFAAAVIIPEGVLIEGLNDSKQLTEKIRMQLRDEIERKCHWYVASLSPAEIDKINILNASIQSMHLALEQLKVPFNHILVDGNRFKPFRDVKHTTVVKGDGKYKSIAAASILAKTHRDEYMEKLALEFPEYQWQSNKGYPTSVHREAIRKYGSNVHHRKSFTLLPAQISLF
ncbi:MAG: ribonuclease HII [Chitinophagaceae bacterium]